MQPIFVFDGPYKPPFKRNKRSGRGDEVSNAMAKRLIRLFGFPIHQAPGEAEAECALLQREGIVDAVLSEDVDTIMFGCNRTLRDWSAAGPRGGKTPTHVTMYDAEHPTMLSSGLDREGMIIIALMSGGDYIPEGVPRCGLKLACEVARAGFGKSLCRIKVADKAGLASWKASLEHELSTNESAFFRTRHKKLVIPSDFPDMKILRYYTHPVVSDRDAIESLKRSTTWKTAVDFTALREFVAETFDWTYRIGAIKLIRVLSPGLLVQGLSSCEQNGSSNRAATPLIRGVSGIRRHLSTDGTPELRVSYIPLDIVPLDLSQETVEEEVSSGRQGLGLNSDDEYDASQGSPDRVSNPGSEKAKATFDPLSPQSLWVPEAIVKLGAPSYVEDWEEKQQAKKQRATRSPKKSTKSSKRKGIKSSDSMSDSRNAGFLDKWASQGGKIAAQITKPSLSQRDQRPKSPTSSWIAPGGPAPLSPSSPSNSRQLHQIARPLSKPRKPPIPTSTEDTEKPTKRSESRAVIGSQYPPRNCKSPEPPETILVSSSPESLPPLSSLLLGKNPPAKSNKPITGHKAKEAELGRRLNRALGLGGTDERRTLDPKPRFSQRKTCMTQTSIKAFMSCRPDGPGSKDTSTSRSRTQPVSGEKEASVATATLDYNTNVADSPKRLETSPSPKPRNDSTSSSGLPTKSARETLGQSRASAVTRSGVRLLVPCVNNEGFFDELEVDHEKAEALTTTDYVKGGLGRVRSHRRAWRHSEVSVIDLTGDD